jgi:hypothetical protein
VPGCRNHLKTEDSQEDAPYFGRLWVWFETDSEISLGIDPSRTWPYNLRCSGSPLGSIDLLIQKFVRPRQNLRTLVERASIEWMQGMARKARDGAPKAG